MLQVIHNNRCTKSRNAITYLEEKGIDFDVRYYLENPLSEKEIKEVLKKLGTKPMDIIRTNEAIWKDEFKGKTFTDAELIKILAENPKLLQRPIIIKDNKAVIGRPSENIDELLT